MEIEQGTNIERAMAVIASGRIVAFPTGTSYGLAADTQQGFALQRVRNLKKRPTEKTFTVFMKSALYDQFVRLTKEERAFLQHDGITLLVEPTDLLAHLSQDNRVGVRSIDNPLMDKLAQASDVPLTATSANRSGEPACFSVEEIQTIFKNPIDDNFTYDLSLGFILDGGRLPPTLPSTIVKLNGNTPLVIRPGKKRL